MQFYHIWSRFIIFVHILSYFIIFDHIVSYSAGLRYICQLHGHCSAKFLQGAPVLPRRKGRPFDKPSTSRVGQWVEVRMAARYLEIYT